MRPHRILLVVRNPIGGIRTFLRYHYCQFDAERYRFFLVAPKLPEIELLLKDLERFDLVYFPVSNDIGTLGLLSVAMQSVRESRCDLVHSHGFTSGLCAIPGARLHGIPHLLTLHETLFKGRFQGPAGFLKRYALSGMLALTDRIQCVSDDARHNLISHLRLPKLFERKLLVIKTGIEVRPFLEAQPRDFRSELALPQDTFLIGFLGRFMPEKGFETLIAALVELKRFQLPKTVVLLCFSLEDGFIREERDRVKQLGLDNEVLFLPFVPSVAETLKGLDVVVMPSYREAAGLLAVEAMVSGVPLIASDCVGLREVVRDSSATVIPTGDFGSLASALANEMAYPSTLKARQFVTEAVRRFDVAKSAKELERVMLSLIDSG